MLRTAVSGDVLTLSREEKRQSPSQYLPWMSESRDRNHRVRDTTETVELELVYAIDRVWVLPIVLNEVYVVRGCE